MKLCLLSITIFTYFFLYYNPYGGRPLFDSRDIMVDVGGRLGSTEVRVAMNDYLVCSACGLYVWPDRGESHLGDHQMDRVWSMGGLADIDRRFR